MPTQDILRNKIYGSIYNNFFWKVKVTEINTKW